MRGPRLVAAGVLYYFFLGVVAGYAYHDWRRDTDNQFPDPVPLPPPFTPTWRP
jgi:hypothetical protein